MYQLLLVPGAAYTGMFSFASILNNYESLSFSYFSSVAMYLYMYCKLGEVCSVSWTMAFVVLGV